MHIKRFKPVGSPVTTVSKKTRPFKSSKKKQQLCLVLDYQSFNKSMNSGNNGKGVIPYYPLTNITDLLARLQKCTIFSSLDLRSDYHHIGLMQEVKLKTVFATTSGKKQWNVAPFVIYSLPGVFCYLMLQVLSELDFCYVYLDNIYSTSWKENLQHLQLVFECLKEANLKSKLSKCQSCKKCLPYLGHLTSRTRYQPLPAKLAATEKFKEPSNIDECHHFHGLTG